MGFTEVINKEPDWQLFMCGSQIEIHIFQKDLPMIQMMLLSNSWERNVTQVWYFQFNHKPF